VICGVFVPLQMSSVECLMEYAASKPLDVSSAGLGISRESDESSRSFRMIPAAGPSLGFLHQIAVLLQRSFRDLCRNTSLLLTLAVVDSLVALLIGLLFYHLNMAISGFQNRMGCLFFIAIYCLLIALTTLPMHVLSRVRTWRDQQRELYHPLTYLVSVMLLDLLPFIVLPPLCFSLITYPLVHFRMEVIPFLSFLLSLGLLNLAACTVCLFIATISHSNAMANLIAVLLFTLNIVCGGLLLSAASTSALSVLRYISLVFYYFEATVVTELQTLQFAFSSGDSSLGVSVSGPILLTSIGLRQDWVQRDWGILAAWSVAAVVATAIVMQYRNPVQPPLRMKRTHSKSLSDHL
jgi:hypothetical protein